jgi:hypothetical protein
MIGSALSGAVLLAERLRLVDPSAYAVEWLFLPPVIGLIAGVIWGVTRPVPALALLRHLETHLDLKERLSSAFLLSDKESDPFVLRQRTDAEAHTATESDLRNALPFTPLPRRVYFAGATTLAAFLLWFLPTLPAFQSPAERAEKASLKRDGERLIRIAKKMETEANTKQLETAKQAAAKLAKLGEEMKKGRLSQQKAMMQAAKLSEELKEAQKALANQTAEKSLATAGQEMRQAMASAQGMSQPNSATDSKNANAKNNLNAPQNAKAQEVKDGKDSKKLSESQKAMSQAANAMSQNNAPSLAEQLSQMADLAQQGKPGDGAERQEMAEQLAALAKALKGTSYESASQALQEASEAMQSGDMGQASQKLREAARKINEAAKGAQTAEAMQKMASALSGQQDGEAMEGAGFEESGEGEGENDAFSADGQLKDGHVHTAECLQPGGT